MGKGKLLKKHRVNAKQPLNKKKIGQNTKIRQRNSSEDPFERTAFNAISDVLKSFLTRHTAMNFLGLITGWWPDMNMKLSNSRIQCHRL